MNSSDIERHPFRTLVIVTALLYGLSIAWFVVPRVLRVVAPEVLRTIVNN